MENVLFQVRGPGTLNQNASPIAGWVPVERSAQGTSDTTPILVNERVVDTVVAPVDPVSSGQSILNAKTQQAGDTSSLWNHRKEVPAENADGESEV